MPFYVLLGGTRNGQRVSADTELDELRMALREQPWPRPSTPKVERYRPTPERRDGFIVARIVSATAARTSTGWASS